MVDREIVNAIDVDVVVVVKLRMIAHSKTACCCMRSSMIAGSGPMEIDEIKSFATRWCQHICIAAV